MRQETHSLKFFFRTLQQRTARSFLANLTPIFTCNLTPYIKLPAYVCTSCSSAKRTLMSVQHGSMTSIQTGRYKANANARSQFCRFVLANK